MEAHHLIWFALGQWAMLALVPLTVGASLLWRAIGRRQDQRRTEARLPKWQQDVERYYQQHALPAFREAEKRRRRQRGNGSTFSERTHGTQQERRP